MQFLFQHCPLLPQLLLPLPGPRRMQFGRMLHLGKGCFHHTQLCLQAMLLLRLPSRPPLCLVRCFLCLLLACLGALLSLLPRLLLNLQYVLRSLAVLLVSKRPVCLAAHCCLGTPPWRDPLVGLDMVAAALGALLALVSTPRHLSLPCRSRDRASACPAGASALGVVPLDIERLAAQVTPLRWGTSRSLLRRSTCTISDQREGAHSWGGGARLRGARWFQRFHCSPRCVSAPRGSAAPAVKRRTWPAALPSRACLLYTSDAADEEDSVDLGGRRIIKKKKIRN
eukprot:TRINITY_DN28903_c0_g1_i1.p1 TRINITY_DN28903_c0_g1~~TRINITY_DN28903_c0_g1_i1.p1  ORF type:complete len:283 (+),score=-1.34 TRINITY_DN28903_c0_g1_i1:199-1047(+)